MTLKTLKDIKSLVKASGLEPHKLDVVKIWLDENCMSKTQLKQEAFNWLKELYLFPGLHEILDADIYKFMTGNRVVYSDEGKHAVINFIKHFFNITEEDLK